MSAVRYNLSYHDLNRYFYLGSSEPIWKVVEIMDETCLCMMVGTNDCAVLSQHMVAPLLEEYDEYWADNDYGWFCG